MYNIDFDRITQVIEELYHQHKQDLYNGNDASSKLPSSDAFFCATDIPRNKKFHQAISQCVSDLKEDFPEEDISVLDAGAGVGILGIYALISGASFVTFIEENKQTTLYLQEVLQRLDISSEKYEIICGDATIFNFTRKYNLVVSETISIDFNSEDFHKIIEHSKKYLLQTGKIIPEYFFIDVKTQEDILNSFTWNVYDAFTPRKIEISKNDISLEGKTKLYKNIEISSGDTISFFNQRFISESGDIFVWGK